jgi:hypothetical protein
LAFHVASQCLHKIQVKPHQPQHGSSLPSQELFGRKFNKVFLKATPTGLPGKRLASESPSWVCRGVTADDSLVKESKKLAVKKNEEIFRLFES